MRGISSERMSPLDKYSEEEKEGKKMRPYQKRGERRRGMKISWLRGKRRGRKTIWMNTR